MTVAPQSGLSQMTQGSKLGFGRIDAAYAPQLVARGRKYQQRAFSDMPCCR